MILKDASILSRTLVKTVNIITNFRQVMSPFTYIPTFRNIKRKYISPANFFQFLQTLYLKKSINYCEDKNELPWYNDEGRIESVDDPTQPLVTLSVIDMKGREFPIEARVGMTVMHAITAYDNSLMPAECGGLLACTSCHVFCKEKESFTPIQEGEQDLIESDDYVNISADSRLSCQMKIIKEFENVRIKIEVLQTKQGGKKGT